MKYTSILTSIRQCSNSILLVLYHDRNERSMFYILTYMLSYCLYCDGFEPKKQNQRINSMMKLKTYCEVTFEVLVQSSVLNVFVRAKQKSFFKNSVTFE